MCPEGAPQHPARFHRPTRRSRGGGEALHSQPAPSPLKAFSWHPMLIWLGPRSWFTVNPGPNQHPALQPCSSVHAPAPFRRSRPPSPRPRLLAVLPSRRSVVPGWSIDSRPTRVLLACGSGTKPRTHGPCKSGLNPIWGNETALRAGKMSRSRHDPGGWAAGLRPEQGLGLTGRPWLAS